MVRNKQGQFFSLYMAVFTLFLCGVVIALYIVQQGNAQSSLVSPRDVLMMGDSLSIFELREVELIKSSLEGASGEFGTDAFLDSFRGRFIGGVMANEKMTDFIFANLFINKVEIREQDKNRNLIEWGVYPRGDAKLVDGKLVFARANVEKRMLLTAKENSKINFPIDFSFNFEKKYIITPVGEQFEVEVA